LSSIYHIEIKIDFNEDGTSSARVFEIAADLIRGQFKHGQRSFGAPITDKAWLDEFHAELHPLSPGDALRVRVKQISKYDERGTLIELSEEVAKVLAVIKPEGQPGAVF